MKSISDIFRSYAVLDSTGRHVNGTDKMSNHNYGGAYESIVGTLRTEANLVMEIGVADGSSLLAWSEVFPLATCVGMDIHHADKAHGSKIEFHIGDQRYQSDCRRVAADRLFDFICEDATHNLGDSLQTLLFMWTYVKPGGVYVIEEFSNIESLRGNVKSLYSCVEVVDTAGPFGGVEPLVVFRKPNK